MGSSKPLSLIQDVATRWNSSYCMLKRLLELKISLFPTIFDERVTKVSDGVKLDIKDAVWAVMELLVPILEPLAEATELLTKQARPTACSVYMLLSHLLLDLVVNEGPSATERGVKEAIATGLCKRFKVETVLQEFLKNAAPYSSVQLWTHATRVCIGCLLTSGRR